MSHSPEQIRQTLLKSARDAGERYLQVRGLDLEAALSIGVPVKQSEPHAPIKSGRKAQENE